MSESVRWYYNSAEKMLIPVAAILEMMAEAVTGGVRKRIMRFGQRSGRFYSQYWSVQRPRPKYQASAPGEPPRSNTSGGLVQHIGTSQGHPVADDVWGIDIGSNAVARGKPYPAYLESGTRTMEPRPAWVVTLQDPAIQKKIMSILTNKALRRKASA